MRTPKNYKENLERGLITVEMLDDVLYSFTKCAKNYRDQARKYRQCRYDSYDNVGRCEENMEMLYKKKSDILGYCTNNLTAIHRLATSRKVRIYDYEDEYNDYLDDIRSFGKGMPSRVVWENSFYDRETEEYVFFIDVTKPLSMYFLYYEFPRHSYHSPINEEDIEAYKSLKVVELEELVTYGENINELLPLQFCDKVWETIAKDGKDVLWREAQT